MGPQFSFKAYSTSTATSPSNDHFLSSSSSSSSLSAAVGSSSAILHTPSPPNTVIYSSSLNSPCGIGGGHLSHGSYKTGTKSSPGTSSLDLGGRQGSLAAKMDGGELDIALQSAVLFPSHDNPLSDLLSDPPEIQNLTLTSLPSDSLPLSSLHAGKEGTAESGGSERGEQKIMF